MNRELVTAPLRRIGGVPTCRHRVRGPSDNPNKSHLPRHRLRYGVSFKPGEVQTAVEGGLKMPLRHFSVCLRVNAAREVQGLIPSSVPQRPWFLLQPLLCQLPRHGICMLMMPLSTRTWVRGTVTVTFHPRSIHTGAVLWPTCPSPSAPGCRYTCSPAHLQLSSGGIMSSIEMQDPTHGSTPHAWLYTPRMALHPMHGSNPIHYEA